MFFLISQFPLKSWFSYSVILFLLLMCEVSNYSSLHTANLMLMKDCHTFQNMFCHFRGYRSVGKAPPLKSCTWFLSRRAKQFDLPQCYYPAVPTEASPCNTTTLVCFVCFSLLLWLLRCLFPHSVFFVLPSQKRLVSEIRSLPSISELAFWAVLDTEVCSAHSYAV